MTQIRVWIYGAFSSPEVWNYYKSQFPLVSTEINPVYDIDVSYDIGYPPSRIASSCTHQILAKYSPGTKITIYGHSYGGNISLMVAELLITFKIDKRNITVITFAAPFDGIDIPYMTKWWSVAFGTPQHKAFLDHVGKDYPVMKHLHSQTEMCDMCKVISFVATANYASGILPSVNSSDGVVSVKSQMYWSGKDWNQVYPVDSNHFEIVQSPYVVTVLRELYGY